MTQNEFTKRCSGCQKFLPVFRFSKAKDRKDGLQHECKACNAKREKKRTKRDWTNEGVAAMKARAEERANAPKPTSAEKQRIWREKNPDKHAAGRKRYYVKKYGMTEQEFDAKYAEQEGKCAICKSEIVIATGNGLHIDHSHDNGRIRALLCGPCNSGLGLFKDDAAKLRLAADYIDFWHVVHDEVPSET